MICLKMMFDLLLKNLHTWNLMWNGPETNSNDLLSEWVLLLVFGPRNRKIMSLILRKTKQFLNKIKPSTQFVKYAETTICYHCWYLSNLAEIQDMFILIDKRTMKFFSPPFEPIYLSFVQNVWESLTYKCKMFWLSGILYWSCPSTCIIIGFLIIYTWMKSNNLVNAL